MTMHRASVIRLILFTLLAGTSYLLYKSPQRLPPWAPLAAVLPLPALGGDRRRRARLRPAPDLAAAAEHCLITCQQTGDLPAGWTLDDMATAAVLEYLRRHDVAEEGVAAPGPSAWRALASHLRRGCTLRWEPGSGYVLQAQAGGEVGRAVGLDEMAVLCRALRDVRRDPDRTRRGRGVILQLSCSLLSQMALVRDHGESLSALVRTALQRESSAAAPRRGPCWARSRAPPRCSSSIRRTRRRPICVGCLTATGQNPIAAGYEPPPRGSAGAAGTAWSAPASTSRGAAPRAIAVHFAPLPLAIGRAEVGHA